MGAAAKCSSSRCEADQTKPSLLLLGKSIVNPSPELNVTNPQECEVQMTHKTQGSGHVCAKRFAQAVFYQIRMAHANECSGTNGTEVLPVHCTVIVRQRMATKQRLT